MFDVEDDDCIAVERLAEPSKSDRVATSKWSNPTQALSLSVKVKVWVPLMRVGD